MRKYKLEKQRFPYNFLYPTLVLFGYCVKILRESELKTARAIYDTICNISGKTARIVLNNPAHWQAMETGYINQPKGLIEKFWLNMPFAQAVRNRLAISVELLKAEIDEKISRDNVKVISIACGSGRGVLLAAKQYPGRIFPLFVDSDHTVETCLQSLAKEIGIKRWKWIRADYQDLKAMMNFRSDIIEVIGLIEYLDDDAVIQLLKSFHYAFPGIPIILAQTHPCKEMKLLALLTNWPAMHLRTRKELYDLIYEAGLSCKRSVTEPHRMISVLTVS